MSLVNNGKPDQNGQDVDLPHSKCCATTPSCINKNINIIVATLQYIISFMLSKLFSAWSISLCSSPDYTCYLLYFGFKPVIVEGIHIDSRCSSVHNFRKIINCSRPYAKSIIRYVHRSGNHFIGNSHSFFTG